MVLAYGLLVGTIRSVGASGWPISVEGRQAARGYPLGVKVSDRELAAVRFRQHDWHGEWNSTALPPLHSRNSKQSYRAETPLCS